MPTPRAPRTLALLVTVLALVLGVSTPAAATPPPTLGSSFVLDRADVLTNAQEAELQTRLTSLASQTGLDLWVVYVDAFTQPSAAEDWANETANHNNLGPHQYLLAVAVDGRAFYLSGDADDGAIDAAGLTAIEQQRVQPRLSAGDYAGAAIAAADGIAAAPRQAAPPPLPSAAAGSGLDLGVVVLAGVLLAAILGALIWLLVRRRAKKAAAPVESVDELARRAGSALVAADDAVKTSEQELGFARAQFGDAAAAPFTDALAQAKADLDRAFTISQQLDDETPETPEQQRAAYTEILRLCATADEALDAKAREFDELRALEADAPAAIARADEQQTAVRQALETTTAALRGLRERYASEALSTVADNPDQARARLDLAAEQLTAARAALAAGRTGDAAVAIRAAQAAAAQADVLERAVTSLEADLDAAVHRSNELVSELEADLTAAAGLPDPDGRVARTAEAVRAQLEAARPALAAPRLDPLRALAALENADTTIDTVMREVRDADASRRRAAAQLDGAVVQARARVGAVADFISARRGAVGATARTRLAEAGAALDQAERLRATDPAAALAAAQRSAQLAEQAGSLAQDDVGSFAPTGGGDMMGALLGGIAINALMGGGRARSGFGGSGFGSTGLGGGGFGGGPRARSGGGGFGGASGGGRSRRGGGRF